ncbi:MAG: hypothetical protein C0518_07800 [Opitutus sp.]|nr:hypothetical protein [Opitutus sp.]
MKTHRLFLFPAIGALVAMMGLAGCNILPEPQPDNTRFYVLESSAPAPASGAAAVRLGLRRVDVPAYLKSKAMVVRSGNNELRYPENARWAEPLDAGIARVLRDQLSAKASVAAYPFPAQVERDFDIAVQIIAAEGHDDGVRFTALFELSRASDSAVVVRRTFTAPVVAWNGDYSQLAAQLSVAVAGLANEILAAVPAK